VGECPLITPFECLREAWHAEEDNASAAAALKRAARTIEFKDAQLAALVREVRLFMQAFDNEGPSVTGGALRNLREYVYKEQR
jgi:hypothetical protein